MVWWGLVYADVAGGPGAVGAAGVCVPDGGADDGMVVVWVDDRLADVPVASAESAAGAASPCGAFSSLLPSPSNTIRPFSHITGPFVSSAPILFLISQLIPKN